MMATTGKRRLVRGTNRKISVDSDDDVDLDVITPTSASATTTDEIDSDEPYVKRVTKSTRTKNYKKSSATMQFLDNFLTEFTPDELAAKRTVEVIYSSSGSFSYTFRSLQESILSQSIDSHLVMSFLKALSAVADERYIRDLWSNAAPGVKAKSAQMNPSVVDSTVRNYEMLLTGVIKRLEHAMTMDPLAVGWSKLESLLRCFLNDGLSTELTCLVSTFFDQPHTGIDSIMHCLERLKNVINTLDGAWGHTDTKLASKHKPGFNAVYYTAFVSRIQEIVGKLRESHRLLTMTVANRPESEGLEALVNAIEGELGLTPPLNYSGEHIGLDVKVECIKMMLDKECCDILVDQELKSDTGFIRQKFANICLAFEEQRRRQQDEQAELMKKNKSKRDAVSYILARVAEAESANAPANIKHPYYIIGIPPSMCSDSALKKYGRKLKTLLHPDTEHDAEWKPKAERAFKEASLALEKCSNFNSFSHASLRMAAQPPFAAYIGLPVSSEPTSEPTTGSSMPSTDNVLTSPTLLLMPVFTLSCVERKTGSINVILDPSTFTMNGFSKLGKNKRLIVYMHRPTHSDEPSSFRVNRSCVSEVKKVALPESVHGKQLSAKIDAVQPIVFGNAWRYFVGLQLVGDLGASLVVWNSIYVELATKGRTAAHVGKLLYSFVGATFVNQELLQSHLARCREGAKADAEAFLQDCSRSAQRWADEQ
ncbi:hypothetical protein protein, putative [Babesia ovis]|uniref:J domain-containing protein n=1 Tax=Babesia ovis TaxID=5869 RepID=A0A9W5WUU1_BABOV|nr:hypothetical protein protein, putative [Babesia ovis]